MLVLTRACNLDCTYCYEGGWHHGSPMGVDTAMKALEMVASQKTPFHVQLTGGEPLLAADLLCAILDRIRKEGWPATTAVQTNGVLLNRDCARVFKAHGTAVGISVDGLPGIQEKLRGQSAATYRAMGILDREQVPFSITTVLTSLNTSELSRLAMALHSFPMASALGLDLLVQKGSARQGNGVFPPDYDTLHYGVSRLLETIDILNTQRKRPLIFREKELLLKALKRGKPAPYCQVSTGSSLAVTPEGELYPCTQTMGDPAFLLGTLDHPFPGKSVLSECRLADESECKGCELQGRCPGDCPSRLFYNGDDASGLICTLYRTIYDYLMNKGK